MVLFPLHEIRNIKIRQIQPGKRRMVYGILYLCACQSAFRVILWQGGNALNRIKDAQIVRLIEQIGEHYRTNISNRFLRPALLQLQVDKNTWDQIEVLTEKMELFRYQGFHLDELYRQIAACARFVEVARNKSMIKSKLQSIPAGQDKILRDMAVSNFSSNLKVFADLLNELYVGLVEMDKKDAGDKYPPVYSQMYELVNIGRLLVGH
jgi:hypothetical protein